MNDSSINKPPFFSIVMPVYNAASFIAEAIESVFAQSFDDWELVIVDDCSTDGSYDIASGYLAKSHNVRLYRRERNSGSAFAPRKQAVMASRGSYVVSLDADDTIEPGFLAKMQRRIEATGADAVYCRLVRGGRSLPVEEFDISAVYRGHDLLQYTLGSWKIAPNGCIGRRFYVDMLTRCVCDGDDMNADELLSRQLMVAAPKIAFSDAEYIYRVNPGSISSRIDYSRFDILKTDMNLKRLIYENYPEGSEERALINVQLFNDTVGMISFAVRYRRQLEGNAGEIETLIERSRQSIDFQLTAGRVSRGKMLLLRAGVRHLKLAMQVYGCIKGRK